MIRIQAESMWKLAEVLEGTDSDTARAVEEMANDEEFWWLDTPDPALHALCDLWKIAYETL